MLDTTAAVPAVVARNPDAPAAAAAPPPASVIAAPIPEAIAGAASPPDTSTALQYQMAGGVLRLVHSLHLDAFSVFQCVWHPQRTMPQDSSAA